MGYSRAQEEKCPIQIGVNYITPLLDGDFVYAPRIRYSRIVYENIQSTQLSYRKFHEFLYILMNSHVANTSDCFGNIQRIEISNRFIDLRSCPATNGDVDAGNTKLLGDSQSDPPAPTCYDCCLSLKVNHCYLVSQQEKKYGVSRSCSPETLDGPEMAQDLRAHVRSGPAELPYGKGRFLDYRR